MSGYIDSLAQNVAERVVANLGENQVFTNQMTSAVASVLSRTHIELPVLVITSGALLMTASVMMGNFLYDLTKPNYLRQSK